MKKFITTSLLAMTLVTAPFIKVQEAKAASMTEYALLSALISKILTAAGANSSYDMSKVQYCSTANSICNSAETDLTNAKLNGQVFQAAGIKCIYEFYSKNKRYPSTEEMTTSCGSEVSIAATSNAIITSANTTKIKSCELKALACKDFPAVLNPIQQQFQIIAPQL